jgi:hypothetical protein
VVERTAAEDRTDRARQVLGAVEVAAQPMQSGRIDLRLARNRVHAPAIGLQQVEQGPADLAAAAEHQRPLHPRGARDADCTSALMRNSAH